MPPMAPQMQGHPHFPTPSGAPPNSHPQYIAPQPQMMTQSNPAHPPPAQSSPRQENSHSQVTAQLNYSSRQQIGLA